MDKLLLQLFAQSDTIGVMLPMDLMTRAEYAEPQLRSPRLGLVHVVFWIIVTALLLGLEVGCDVQATGVWPTVESLTAYALPALNAAFFAMILVTAAAVVRQRQRPDASRLQPGHWLLIVLAAKYLVSLPFTCLWSGDQMPDSSQMNVIWIGSGAYGLLGAALYALAASQQPKTERWRTSFQMFALAHLFSGLTMLAFAIPGDTRSAAAVFCFGLPAVIVAIVAGGSFLWCAMIDVNTHRRRDSLHWLGVAAVAIATAIQLALRLVAPAGF